MKIFVGDLLKRVGNEANVSDEERVSFPEDELVISSPVKVQVHLVNIGRSILVSGTFKATVKLACVRCLKEFELPIEVEVEEQYSGNPPAARENKAEVELKDDDFVFKIDDDGSINLTEAIRQNLITALPIKPLCSRSCKGAEKEAIKEVGKIDPRLAKYKDILKK